MISACKTVIMNHGDAIFIINNRKEYIKLRNRNINYNECVNGDLYVRYQCLPNPTIIYTFLWEDHYEFIPAYDWEKLVVLSEAELMIKDIIE